MQFSMQKRKSRSKTTVEHVSLWPIVLRHLGFFNFWNFRKNRNLKFSRKKRKFSRLNFWFSDVATMQFSMQKRKSRSKITVEHVHLRSSVFSHLGFFIFWNFRKNRKKFAQKPQIFATQFLSFRRCDNAIFDAKTKIAIKNYRRACLSSINCVPAPRILHFLDFSKKSKKFRAKNAIFRDSNFEF